MPMRSGVYCPTITITDDSGRIDREKWGQHLDHLIDAGITGILVFGSIGEFYSFSMEEKKDAVAFAAEHVAGRVPLYVGVGATRVADVVELANYCEGYEVAGLFLISPYYFGPSHATAKEFFTTVANATTLPIVLYNFPARTGTDLSPALVAELASSCPNIVGLKDTVDNISHTRAVIEAVAKVAPEFRVFSGFDEYYTVNRIAGGAGVVSGLTNVEPETFVALHKAYEAANFAGVVGAASRISHLMALYGTTDLFISAIKGAVKAAGLEIATQINAPATQLNEEQERTITRIIG
ncbi:4-hydroxy-tetrahydrodipicolinate synthase [Arcanobacterium wilhelmae]|uniref:4-hydroxy-tetrahydrodipicolinate synthase n=1 Tax=Arcanobacterium wilhelmae TaxID=1803177 RepID=A0ABT9NBG1_9ACTO|nr:dihydrodipicolinate synthase family protein [Arcanobacterium wilhelmae]MDP9801002.1 4-hydroxy-tetrahydrodipicolinate synthase [Arcanobacterium wilhelmae]WFN90362.1 dihydrodipicolinate synthase family protein [Arcanobacterium wilhelmae]